MLLNTQLAGWWQILLHFWNFLLLFNNRTRSINHQKCLRTSMWDWRVWRSQRRKHILQQYRREAEGADDKIGFWICFCIQYLYWDIWEYSSFSICLFWNDHFPVGTWRFKAYHIHWYKTHILKSVCLENESDFIIKVKKIQPEMCSQKKAVALYKGFNNI